MMIKHYKGEPNVYVIRYRSGKLRAHGEGLDFSIDSETGSCTD